MSLKNWTDSIRYDQIKNAVEEIIRKIKIECKYRIIAELKKTIEDPEKIKMLLDIIMPILEKVMRGYLESCGICAFLVIMEGFGAFTADMYPNINGITIQSDDFVMMLINDSKNNIRFSSGDVMDNRVMKNYVALAWMLFKVKAKIYKNRTYDEIKKFIDDGHGVQICFKDPGHYVACGALNFLDEILYKDSWDREGLKTHGQNEILTEHEYNTNVHSSVIVYFKPEEEVYNNSGERKSMFADWFTE